MSAQPDPIIDGRRCSARSSQATPPRGPSSATTRSSRRPAKPSTANTRRRRAMPSARCRPTSPTPSPSRSLMPQPEAAHPSPRPARRSPMRRALFEAGPQGVAARITIHLFCELAETAAIGEQALKDRRLARASGAIFTGGLPAAVARYQNQPTPSLIIVEATTDAQPCWPTSIAWPRSAIRGTKVMVIGAPNDIAPLSRTDAPRRQRIPGPAAAAAAADRRHHQPLRRPGRALRRPPVAFCRRQGRRRRLDPGAQPRPLPSASGCETNTVLVDLDLPFGTAGLDFNQDPLQGVADALASPTGSTRCCWTG